MHWRRWTRRLRMGLTPLGWRDVYFDRYLMIRQLAAVLELRLGGRIAPEKLRDLDRLASAERSPAAAAWLLARTFRPLIGRNETLGRERVLLGSLVWRLVRGGGRAAATAGLEPGGRLGGVALLALVLPVGGLAEAGRLDHLEAEHRALHPGRRDVDAEQVEDVLLGQVEQLLARLARRARR